MWLMHIDYFRSGKVVGRFTGHFIYRREPLRGYCDWSKVQFRTMICIKNHVMIRLRWKRTVCCQLWKSM